MQRFGFAASPNGGWVDADKAIEIVHNLQAEIAKLRTELSELKEAAAGIVAEFEKDAEIAEFGGKDPE